MYYGRKKGIIIGIVVAIIVILLVAISVFVLLKTDLFKSNKTLFWKYAGAGLESFEQTPNIQLEEIEKLKMQSPYILQGELTLNNEESDKPENIKLVINGEADKANEYTHMSSKVQYENNTIFDLEYVNNNNVYALKSDEIVTAFLGIKNENLKVLFQKLGITDTSIIPDFIIFEKNKEIFKLTQEEKKHINETYINVIQNTIAKENYSRQTSAVIEKDGVTYNTTSYRLDLNKEQISNIILNTLNTLKTDNISLNLIKQKVQLLNINKENIETEEIINILDEITEEIQNTEFKDISFVVYNYKGETIQTEIIIKNEGKIVINAKKDNVKLMIENYNQEENTIELELTNKITSTQTNIKLKIDINNETQINIDLINTGSASQKSLNTTCEISIANGDTQGNITYNQTLEFIDELENIIELNETNSAILNDYSKEDLNILLPAIQERMVQVISEKIQTIVEHIIMNDMLNNEQANELHDQNNT